MQHTMNYAQDAQSALMHLFLEHLTQSSESLSFGEFEDYVVEAGHAIMAKAMSEALNSLDDLLCANLPRGTHVHDRRTRSLATRVGDVSFYTRRIRTRGETQVPLAEALDLPWGCRISPGAEAFLVDAGVEVSYAKAARLLVRAGGSRVSSTAVMGSLRRAGKLCEQDDDQSARSLTRCGVLPDATDIATDICVETDGTWVRLQNMPPEKPQRVEIKALVAYAGKETQGTKVSRIAPIRHACIAKPIDFWEEGVATIGSRFDLSKIERVHFGLDGESWCKSGQFVIPAREGVTAHLDPFHVNRAVASCFKEKEGSDKALGILAQGDVKTLCSFISAAQAHGLTKNKITDQVLRYLDNNKDLIGVDGPSLGTMESENQHLYGARMDAVPCAWSIQGASDMARLRSRVYSKRKIPARTRENSKTKRRIKREERRQLKSSGMPMIKSVGKGYESPHIASVSGLAADVKHAAAVDSGMIGIG